MILVSFAPLVDRRTVPILGDENQNTAMGYGGDASSWQLHRYSFGALCCHGGLRVEKSSRVGICMQTGSGGVYSYRMPHYCFYQKKQKKQKHGHLEYYLNCAG